METLNEAVLNQIKDLIAAEIAEVKNDYETQIKSLKEEVDKLNRRVAKLERSSNNTDSSTRTSRGSSVSGEKKSYYTSKRKTKVVPTFLNTSRRSSITSDMSDRESIQGVQARMSKLMEKMDALETKNAREQNYWEEVEKGKKCGVIQLAKLVEQNCNVNWVRNGKRALDYMVEVMNAPVAQYLHAQGGQFTTTGKEMFLKKLEESEKKAVDLYLECGLALDPRKAGKALLKAIATEQQDIVEVLLKMDASCNVTNFKEGSALICAVSKKNMPLIDTLLEKKADVNVASPWGGTAINTAVEQGDIKILKKLIAEKGNPDVKDKSGITPLIKAIEIQNSRMIQILINEKCDVNLCDNQGFSPLDLSVKNDRLMELNWLIHAGADLDRQHVGGRTALMFALNQGKEALAGTLIESKADVNIPDDEGSTPLIVCAEKGYEDLLEPLIAHKADLNHKNKNDFGAIHVACLGQMEYFVECLIDAGCDRDLSNSQFGTPTEIVRNHTVNQVIDVMLNPPADIDSSSSSESEEEEEKDSEPSEGGATATFELLVAKVPEVEAFKETFFNVGVNRDWLIKANDDDLIGLGIADENLRKKILKAAMEIQAETMKLLEHEEIPTKLQELFSVIDLDGSGAIDEAEFHTALVYLQVSLDQETMTKVYKRIDLNSNGSIGAHEFAVFLQSPHDDERVEELKNIILAKLSTFGGASTSVTKGFGDMKHSMEDIMKSNTFDMSQFGNLMDFAEFK